MDDRASTMTLDLTPAEVALIRTALGHLEATLGREEADQLEQVQQLLARLEPLDAR